MTSNAVRQRRYRARRRDDMAVLSVEVQWTRLVEWLIASELLSSEDAEDRAKVAQALWQAARMSIISFEYEIR